MMTFQHRDHRLASIDAVAARLDSEIADIRETLAAIEEDPPIDVDALKLRLGEAEAFRATLAGERAHLATDRFEVSDQNGEALARDLVWRTTADLVATLAADPPLVAMGERPLLTDASAAAVEALPRGGATPRAGFLDEIAATGADVNAVEQLVGIALGRWLRQPAGTRSWPFREIGVLLPLRLETLFEEHDGAWKMLVRVTPDETSILRHSSVVTPMEKEFLAAFWQGSFALHPVPGAANPVDWLLSPQGAVAWETLANRVTPTRAAWLVTAFPIDVVAGAFVANIPADSIGDPQAPQRVVGLPEVLSITIVDKNLGQLEVGVLKPAPPTDDLRVPKDRDALDSWLISWPRARDVGLGAEIRLPDGVTPETITALYVFGIGEETPDALFRAHVDAGDLALMRLGAPTNTIHGAPTADLAKDAEAWRTIVVRRLSGESGAGVAEIGEALCGDAKALPYLSGASNDLDISRLMVACLWPALWGHYFRDIWNRGDQAFQFWRWALKALHPEGPLLPIRIGAQPYGLLPATALGAWQASDGDEFDRVEEKLIRELSQLIPVWVAAAEGRGTVVGADTGALLRLLAQPGVSDRYVYRSFVIADQLAHAYPRIDRLDFMQAAETLWRPTRELLELEDGQPRVYLASGHARQLNLPLIGSRRLLPLDLTLTEMAKQIYEIEADRFADVFYGKVMRNMVPHSLLIRLAMHSMFLAKAWFMQSIVGNEPLLNPVRWDDIEILTLIEARQTGFRDSSQSGHGGEPIKELMFGHQESIFRLFATLDKHLAKDRDPLNPNSGDGVMQLTLPPEQEAEMERALRATLDAAGHRIDPLATGIAYRRLRQHAVSGRGRNRLGAYGWLDGPFLGKPGPTAAGRLHAPSHAQTLTSIILRDKQLSAQDELAADGRNIWQMNLSSSCVRIALAMADDVRSGFHIFEVVGRMVEGVVAARQPIETLRGVTPLRPDAPDRRDVCHGVKALEGLIAGQIADVLSDDADERQRQLVQLRNIRTALEAYSDLLIAEGVHQVVSGHAELAADAMDAAAGFARPPAFDFIRTPPSGYRLATSVLTVLPHRPSPATGLPIELADASLAAFLGSRFADVDGWVWTVSPGPGDAGQPQDVALSDLGLTPLETVFISEDVMAEVVRSAAHRPNATVAGAVSHRLIRQLAGVLGGTPPLVADIARAPDVSNETILQNEQNIRAELSGRLDAIRAVLEAFIDETHAPGLDDPGRLAWLRRALVWGVFGAAPTKPRNLLCDLLFGGAAPEADDLTQLVASAREGLEKRHAVEVDASASAATLVRAISDLVYPGGRLAVTARWTAANLRAVTGLATGAADATLETDWLTILAAVRPVLARIEAIQLEAGILGSLPPLTAWANSPQHWREADVAANVAARKAGKLHELSLDRFVVAFGTNETWQGADVAVTLVDQFTEAVPMAERSTYAAIGFNAPAARPPQAILLAVPPQSDRPLDSETVLNILIETRQLLRARATRPEDVLGHPLVPSMWLDGASPLRVRLDSGSYYWR